MKVRFPLFLAAACLAVSAASWAEAALTPDRVVKILNGAIKNKATPQTIWNEGFLLFQQYGADKETAGKIAAGYKAAIGFTPEQKEILTKAVRYWQIEYEYWGKPKPGDFNDPHVHDVEFRLWNDWDHTLKPFPIGDASTRPASSFINRPNRSWESTLKMYKPLGR